MCRSSVALLLCVILLAGCDPQKEAGPGPLEQALARQFERAEPLAGVKVAASGTEDNGPLIGIPIDVAVGPRDSVFVADRQRAVVWVLSPKGDSLGRIGRPGQGPGELSQPTSVSVGPADSLFVVDGRRVSVFGPSLGRPFVRSFRPERSNYRGLAELYPTPAGPLLARYQRPKNPNLPVSGNWLVEISRGGALVQDSIAYLPQREYVQRDVGGGTQARLAAVGRPFGRKPVFASGSQGEVYFAWTDSFTVRRYSAGGRVETVLNVDVEPALVTDSEVDSVRALYDGRRLRMLEERGFHDTHPVFASMMVDREGRFWVGAPVRPAEQALTYYVIDPAVGTFCEVTLPLGRVVRAATPEYVYVISPRSPAVHIYRL